MARIATLLGSTHAMRRAFCYESGYLRDSTGGRHVDAVHLLVFAAPMRANNRRPFPQVYHPRRRTGVCLYLCRVDSQGTTMSRSVTHTIFHSCLLTLTTTCTCAVWCADEHDWSDVQGRKDEKSSVSCKETHPEWTPTDPTGLLYLSRVANDHTRRPPGITVAGPTTDRE